MSNDIQVLALSREPGDVLRFLQVSYTIYNGDAHWVAPLLMDLKKVFTDENPLFEHARMQLWVARNNGEDVGRIAAVIDDAHNRTHPDKPAAFFGFFVSTNDPEVCRRLIGAAASWTEQAGLTRLLGPMNPTTKSGPTIR